eukprot:PhM_4_TR11352/c0_g1_i1/m.1549
MMIPQLLTFIVYASSATFFPHLSLLLPSKGFSPEETGAAMSALRVVMFVVTPIWCFVADNWFGGATHHRTTPILFSILAGCAAACAAVFAVADEVGSAFVYILLYGVFSGPKSALCDTLILQYCSSAMMMMGPLTSTTTTSSPSPSPPSASREKDSDQDDTTVTHVVVNVSVVGGNNSNNNNNNN